LIIVFILVLLLVGLLVMKSLDLLPGHPYHPDYVVNRDGHYYVGDRCAQGGLADVGVFPKDPYPREQDEAYFDIASWHAVVEEPGVKEIEIFAADQSGVSIVYDDGQRPYLTKVFIAMLDVRGYWSSTGGVLDKIETGIVATNAGGWVPEDEYWQMPNHDFEC